MKRCSSCGQILAQRIKRCPACGGRQTAGMTAVDDYRIIAVIHEGRSSLVCRAVKKKHDHPVTIRVFTDQSGVDTAVAARLEKELDTLSRLPPDLFVQHYAIRQSREGLWYRISEWVDADNWGSIFVSGILNDQRRMATLFYNIATALECLHAHDHFMPYLILDDILLPRDRTRHLSVKINYKLSRFLNARATHHGPMLQKLLQCHPDIINKRAIDFRSGIWSLGKVFAELLTADPNLTEFSSRIDRIEGLDPKLAVLVKVMLSDDPDLRPQSMAKVVQTLERILDTIPPGPVYQIPEKNGHRLLGHPRFKLMAALILVVITCLAAAGTAFYMIRAPSDRPHPTPPPLESHTRSVGFLMVEYWLAHQEKIFYKNKVEGTAFLVDKNGYLLTNRHVACPWLEDATLLQIRNRFGEQDIRFGRRMYLWFEGAKAFNRYQEFDRSADPADAYYLAGAFKTGGKGNLRVAGVPREPRRPGERRNRPFKNDFAVLKIDDPPEGILPIPLASDTAPEDIKRLSPVIIMGFPLGSQTQDEYVNASMTRGYVRRTSRELIQVDSSIYKGNSGGPAINEQGRVIGIASGVITDQPMGHIPLKTPLSDFGLVLPIAGPAGFVESLKAGQAKWDGMLDFALEKKLARVVELAEAGNFKGAADTARSLLAESRNPALLFTAALMDFCANDLDASRSLFARLLSIEGENMASRLMLYTIDRLENRERSRDLTAPLFSLSWDHPDEFQGFLARVLESGRPMDPENIEYENRYEKAWRTFILGLVMETENRPGRAIALYKQVVFTAGANDHLYFMAASRLALLLAGRAAYGENPETAPPGEDELWKEAARRREKAKKDYDAAVELIQKVETEDLPSKEKTQAFESLLTLSPDNRTIMGRAAFFHAREGRWDQSVSYIDRYFKERMRETAMGLSLGLLKGQLLKLAGKGNGCRKYLNQLRDQIQNPWYRIMVRALLEKTDETKLMKLAAGRPSRLIILHTALGLDAEAAGDREEAARHYREALGTYLDDWNEYDLAWARLAELKSQQTN
ncbi:MAG: trypsin-like peptidase domain-containing protein [Desulfobacter sp.]|nr:MAG: trypsin-like peptidase domain-containing protein [Desulfobacter sp.]